MYATVRLGDLGIDGDIIKINPKGTRHQGVDWLNLARTWSNGVDYENGNELSVSIRWLILRLDERPSHYQGIYFMKSVTGHITVFLDRLYRGYLKN
jgi:hypothetical protein